MKPPSLILISLVAGCAALAEPAPLAIDDDVPGMAKVRHIRNVHQEIATGTDDLSAVRSAIVRSMSKAKGGPWTLEGEGDGYILARLQYDENSVTLRIEYNAKWVQLKYADATNAYVCEIVVGDGICYKNYRDYFGFSQNLRGTIARELKRSRRQEQG